jgi:hypothetical protein
MSYQLVISGLEGTTTKGEGEVFLDDLPFDSKVFLLYYPGGMPNEDLEDGLRKLGKRTGKNLFVNIGRLDDPNYEKIVNKFNITTFPVMIITAIDALASSPAKLSTAYVKIDNEKLLNSQNFAIDTVYTLFNLFIAGKISEAMCEYEKVKREESISRLKNTVANALKNTGNKIGGFLAERDISVSLAEVKFELKKSDG